MPPPCVPVICAAEPPVCSPICTPGIKTIAAGPGSILRSFFCLCWGAPLGRPVASGDGKNPFGSAVSCFLACFSSSFGGPLPRMGKKAKFIPGNAAPLPCAFRTNTAAGCRAFLRHLLGEPAGKSAPGIRRKGFSVWIWICRLCAPGGRRKYGVKNTAGHRLITGCPARPLSVNHTIIEKSCPVF